MLSFAFQVFAVSLAFIFQGIWALPYSLLDRGAAIALGGSQWVDIWTAMPQLTEPANLPPVPFVCSNPVSHIATCFRLTSIPEPE